MLNVFLKLIAAATAAAIAEALLPDGGAKGGIAGGAVGALVKPEQKKTKTTQKRQEVSANTKTRPESKKIEPKKQEPSTDIEVQLEAARERLRRFNEMEEREGI